MEFRGQLPHSSVVQYVRSGNATITILNSVKGTRYTYRVRAPKTQTPGRDAVHWVSLLTGPDNENGYTYLGTIFTSPGGHSQFRLTSKSKVTAEAPSFKAFDYVYNNLALDTPINPVVQVWHEGRCGRCAHPLTVPESVASGFGPECRGKLGIDTPDLGPAPQVPVDERQEDQIERMAGRQQQCQETATAPRPRRSSRRRNPGAGDPATTLRSDARSLAGENLPCPTCGGALNVVGECSICSGALEQAADRADAQRAAESKPDFLGYLQQETPRLHERDVRKQALISDYRQRASSRRWGQRDDLRMGVR